MQDCLISWSPYHFSQPRNAMMPAQISLQLEKTSYRPGDTVRGTLHLSARSELRPRDVVLHVFGEEVIMLGPNSLMSERSHTFDLSISLWKPAAHDDKLPQGEHDFPVEFVLPAGLPPSFNGEFTRIVYLITGKVDLPLHSDIHHEHQFNVLPAPLTETEKPVRTVAQSPQGVRVELALTASGFYPGDHIQGTLQVTGLASAKLTAVIVEIVSREKAEAHEFVDHFDKVRVRAEIDPAQLSGGQSFPIDLPIPEDADPSFVGQHSAKSRLVRATLHCANAPALITEVPITLGAK
jgi:sporulation-control protein spo0M